MSEHADLYNISGNTFVWLFVWFESFFYKKFSKINFILVNSKLNPGVGDRPVITNAHLSQVDWVA